MNLASLRAGVDAGLFPPDRRRRSGSPWEGALLAASFLALVVVAQLLRPGLRASLDSLWAEDGPIFLQTALWSGFNDAIWTPYAGYLVLVPRLIGEGAATAPLGDAAAATSILAALAVGLSGLAVWHASRPHIGDPYLRGALVALTVLAPVAGLESVDSAAYVPWYMLFASFWLLLWRPPSRLATVLAACFLLLTGLSTPGLWFFLPLAALRACTIHGPRDATIVGAYGIGALVQIPVYLANREGAIDPSWTSDIATAYLQRVLDGALLGEKLGGTAWEHLGWPFLLTLVALAAIGLAAGLRHSGQGPRWFAAIAIPISVALFALSAYQRAVGSEIVWPSGIFHGAAGRYAIVPALLLVSVAFVLVDERLRASDAAPRGWLRPLALGLAALALVTSFDQRHYATRGTPTWSDALDAAAAECRGGASDVPVAISPPGFGLQVPCDRVEAR